MKIGEKKDLDMNNVLEVVMSERITLSLSKELLDRIDYYAKYFGETDDQPNDTRENVIVSMIEMIIKDGDYVERILATL
jgi:hypothetical protein